MSDSFRQPFAQGGERLPLQHISCPQITRAAPGRSILRQRVAFDARASPDNSRYRGNWLASVVQAIELLHDFGS